MKVSSLNCPSCKNTVFEADIKCEMCGFPIKGTDKEKSIFIGQKYANKQRVADGKRTFNGLRFLLFVIGGLKAGVVLYNIERLQPVDTMINLVVASIYLGLGFLAIKKPFIAFVSALIFFVGWQLLMYLVDPGNIFLGLIWQIIIIASLIVGILKAKGLKPV